MLQTLLLTTLLASVGVQEKTGARVPTELVLRDETARPVTLGALLDKPTLLTLNYFRCAGVCSPQLNAIADSLNRMGPEPGRDFQVLTVSFDPRDTPALAARKRDNYLHQIHRPLAPGAWRFITGDAAATRALADAVGFGFTAQGEDYAHPAVLIVLSPKGRVTRYVYGLTYLPAELQLAAQDAARDRTGPSVAKLLAVCYRYDPDQQRTVFSVTRLVGTVLVAAALIFLGGLLIRGRRRVRP